MVAGVRGAVREGVGVGVGVVVVVAVVVFGAVGVPNEGGRTCVW